LGGLLQDDEQIDLAKVPILGDIPVIGKAFQSKGKSRVKTNLMVFMRSKIIRNASDARPLTENLLNRARLEEINQSGRDFSKIDNWIDEGATSPGAVRPRITNSTNSAPRIYNGQ
jgi:general secretion pathway protein D